MLRDRDVLIWRPAYQAVSHTLTFSISQEELNKTSAPTIQKSFEGEATVLPWTARLR
jgi:hypothetical protein